MTDDIWFEKLAGATEATEQMARERAPARLKSRVYSAVVRRMASETPLLDLRETKAAGEQLCVFEHVLTILPPGSHIGSMNPCRICHARVLGEGMEHAPIYWPGCPYSAFHNG